MPRRKVQAKATMGEPETVDSLLPLFEMVEDPRVDRPKGYALAEILFFVLCAVVSGVNFVTHVRACTAPI